MRCQGVSASVAPAATSTTPASNCRMNLSCGRSRTRSSTRPTANMKAALAATARGHGWAAANSEDQPNAAIVNHATTPTSVPAAMATPPINAVGR